MKNYKKAILALSVIAALPLMAANNNDPTIYVTTFADEDGENQNACSLREAITAAAMNKAYGGCSAGKTSPSVTDIIQLEAGEYILNSPLIPTSQVSISGATAVSWDNEDVITGAYPERLPLETSIRGNGNFSLFDTTEKRSTLTLNNISLKNGGSRRGGAIHAGGGLSLNRVVIRDSMATEAGGAIYLSGRGSSVNISNSVIENTTAPKGAVLAMSCLDNLVFTTRTITLANSSFVNNGNSSSQSTFEFCGTPAIELTANTIAKNTASATNQGSIIKFTADSRPDSNDIASLSNGSSIKLLSNTIVNNTAFTAFLYDSIASKILQYNIIAYNNGYSCQHLLGGLAEGRTGNISLHYNALNKSATAKDFCDVPYNTLKDLTTVDLIAHSQNGVMTALYPAEKYTAFMPMYFLINAKDNKNPLVNIKETSRTCSANDQRGVTRLADGKLLLDPDSENSCDIGSTELVKLAAADMSSQNASQVGTLEGFERERDFFQALLDDDNTKKEFLKYYEIRRDEYIQKIDDFKNSLKYRQVHFDIFANSVPHEIEQSGRLVVQHLDASLYDVTAKSLGTGADVFESGIAGDLPKEQDTNLKCEWDKKLQHLLMYHVNGAASPSGDFGYCEYTITLKSDKSVKSVGVAQAQFTNIAPIAKNDEYTMQWGTDQRIRLDLLSNDSDDGDGANNQVNYPKDKSQFYVFPDGVSAPIKLGKIDSNLVVEAEFERACPDESRTKCYGGNIYIQPKNSFNKFNYSFTYQVFDADGALSNEATVRLINTATTTDDTRKDTGSSGGGGSFGVFGLLGLAGLAFMRRRR